MLSLSAPSSRYLPANPDSSYLSRERPRRRGSRVQKHFTERSSTRGAVPVDVGNLWSGFPLLRHDQVKRTLVRSTN